MITAIINGLLQIAIPLINLFVKDFEKKRALKEQMFDLIHKNSENALKNVQLKREWDEIKDRAKKAREEKNA